MDKVKLGIIGCGFISDIFAEIFSSLSDKVEVVAACDIDRQKAEFTAEALGAKYVEEDYTKLLDKADAFYVATPHDLHYPMGMKLLEAGKHVLMEKPMALSEKECLELIRMDEKSDAILMIGYMARYHPIYNKIKEIIDSGVYGQAYQASIWTEQFTYAPEGSWIRSAERLGGGQFFSHGCHYVDLLLWFFGRPVKGAHMGTRLCTPWMEKEGTSNAIFEFEGGKLAYHFGTWGAKGTRHSYAVHIFFENGMLEACVNEGVIYYHTSTNTKNYYEVSDPPVEVFRCSDTSHVPKPVIEHFADCILNNEQPKTGAVQALNSLRVIWRMYEAEQKGIIADLSGLGFDEPWDIEGLAKLPE